MSTHVGRVCSYDYGAREARVAIGSAACRVCGGRACAMRGREIRVAVPEGIEPHPGDVVRIRTSRGSSVRALVKLLLLPIAAALAGYVLAGRSGIPVFTVPVLVLVVLIGSRRGDLPVLVAPAVSSGGSGSELAGVFER